MMRILLLGGAGFIGTNLTYRLVEAGYELHVVDALRRVSKIENIKPLIDNGKIRFTLLDVSENEKFKRLVREVRPDLVINLIAESHVDYSINNPVETVMNNIRTILNILETCRRMDLPLIHTSTDEVYGDHYSKDRPAREEDPLRPSNPYSASKASADLLVQAYGRTYGLDYIIIRPTNTYGPYQHPEKLIPRTIVRLLLGKPATIYGDGEQERDWLYIDDLCNAYLLIIEKGRRREIYNVAPHFYEKVRNIVYMICMLLHRDPEKYVIHVAPRPGEDKGYYIDNSKILALGWRPRTSIVEGLERTVEWYVKNRWFWEKHISEHYVTSDVVWRQY